MRKPRRPVIDQPSNPPPHIHNAFGQTRAFWGRWGQGLGSGFLIVGVHFWRLIWPRTIRLPPFRQIQDLRKTNRFEGIVILNTEVDQSIEAKRSASTRR